jgi:hypothetical protein
LLLLLSLQAAAARCPCDGAIASMLRLLAARKGSEFGEQAAVTAAIAVDIAWVLAALAHHSAAHQNAIRLEGAIPLLVSLLEGPAQSDEQVKTRSAQCLVLRGVRRIAGQQTAWCGARTPRPKCRLERIFR